MFVNIEIKTFGWHIQKSGVVWKTICSSVGRDAASIKSILFPSIKSILFFLYAQVQIPPMLPFHLRQFYCIFPYVSFNNVWTTIFTFIQSFHLNGRLANTKTHMRDATECINSIRYGLFVVIKAIFGI